MTTAMAEAEAEGGGAGKEIFSHDQPLLRPTDRETHTGEMQSFLP